MANLGQVFTKENIARFMVSFFDLPKQASIMEPCFGTGVFLDALLAYGYKNVTACEIDTDLFKNTKKKYNQFKLVNIDFLKYGASDTYDGVIMNPPYIRQEKIDEMMTYGITKKNIRTDPLFSDLPSTANMYMYFIVKAIDLLKINGQLIVIFPSSWMNAKNGVKFHQMLLASCGLEKQIHIYGDVFERKALVDVVILKLIKGNIHTSSTEEYLEAKNGELIKVSRKEKNVFEEFSYPFSKLATIRRGLTTGFNKMYINPDLQDEDSKYIKPILSSPKDINGYSTINARLDRLFYPGIGSLSRKESIYLDYWKAQIIQNKTPKTLYEKIKKGVSWYKLPECSGYGILFSYFVRNKMRFIMNESDILARDNFYIITPKIDIWVMFALLNNHYTYYQLELKGKKYGAGILKLQRYDMEELQFPNYEMISESDKEELAMQSHKLVETADISIVEKITKLISKYSETDFKSIMNLWATAKSNRLEGK